MHLHIFDFFRINTCFEYLLILQKSRGENNYVAKITQKWEVEEKINRGRLKKI